MARIDHYDFGRIVVDGREETRDLIILPDRVVRDWWRQEGHALVVDDLREVLDELPAHLVVGTGADGRMRPDPETIQQLRERGVTVEALPPARPCVGSVSWIRHAPQPPSTSPANLPCLTVEPISPVLSPACRLRGGQPPQSRSARDRGSALWLELRHG
jgi:hypothetical protein